MTQLRDDCFANDGQLMPLAEALALLDQRLTGVTTPEIVPLDNAYGRITAEPVRAEHDVPPHDNSAVDGYAVYFDDLESKRPTKLPVTGRVAAGHPLDRPTRRGEALRMFTGAPMPTGDGDDGPDTVFMQEDCEIHGDMVELPPGITRGANRRRAGEDVKRGTVVFEPGRWLRPEDIGLLASLGKSALLVNAPLRIALFSTGDEVREPGTPLAPGTIYDANRHTLAALLAGLPCRVADLGILKDDRVALRSALKQAARENDVLITSGGVSVGDEDHVKPVVETLGDLTLWRLAIKPGRPVALGQIKDGDRAVPIIGLPGNPAAVMVTFLRFARPLILKLAGASETTPRHYLVRAGFTQSKKAGRREFVRCRLETGDDAMPVAVKAGRQGAGMLSTVVGADGLVELAEEMTYVEAGTAVEFLPFNEVR